MIEINDVQVGTRLESSHESSQSLQAAQISCTAVSMHCSQSWDVFNLLTMRNRSSGARSYEFLSGVEVEVVEVVTPRWTSFIDCYIIIAEVPVSRFRPRTEYIYLV